MNKNVKEIGHISYKLKNEKEFRNYYENVLGLNIGSILKTSNNEDRIIYYQLNRGQFIEIFPETSAMGWPTYDGYNKEQDLSYQYATIGNGNNSKETRDPENNILYINDGELYISKLTFNVNNLTKSKKFYTDILNLDIIDETEKYVHIKVNNTQIIELINHPYPKNNCTNNKGYCHFALIVHDIELSAQRMSKKGIQLYHGPKTMKDPYTEPYKKVPHSENTYNFYIQDYDDNEIEDMCYSPESYQLKHAKK